MIIEAQAQVETVENVAVSVASLAGIVADIGGELINTSVLLNQEVDPHSFTVTTGMLALADAADLLVLAGHYQWEEDLANRTSTPFITLHSDRAWENYEDFGAQYSPMPGTSSVDSEDGHAHDGNPHAYWLLPKNAIAIANATRAALTILNGTYTDTWNANFAAFVDNMDYLQRLITELDAIHDFSELRAVAVTPAEAYVAETFGIECVAVLQIEDLTISGAKLLEVQSALRNGSVQLIVGSDVAQFQTGGEFAYQIQADYGGTLIWWKTVYFPESDYFSMMTFNLGALVSGLEGRSGGTGDQTINLGLVALILVLGFIALLEATLLIQRIRAE